MNESRRAVRIRLALSGLLLPLLLGATPWDAVDVEAARRLVRIARDAEDAGQMAAVRTLLTRALVLDPDQSTARQVLLFVKDPKTKEWKRSLDDEVKVARWTDADPAAAASFLGELEEMELWRSRRYVRLYQKEPEARRDPSILEALLRVTPREPSVHEALGHPKVGDLHVRPPLVDLVRRRPTVEKRWSACRSQPFVTSPAEEPFAVPGVPNELPTVLCEGQEFVSTNSEEDNVRIAVEARRAYALVAELLGTKVEPWAPLRFCLLDPIGYRRMIYAIHDDPDEQASRLRFASYEHQDFVALQADTVTKAFDTVSHTVAYKTMQLMVAPGAGEKRDVDAYAFMKEGFGYLVSLAMYDTATTWFHSGRESSAKVDPPVPEPEVKNTESLTAWLQTNARRGTIHPLPEVFGRSLNNLDFLASMEAWSFLRFLALLDSSAFRNFPLFLREKEEGPIPERVAAALEAAYEKKAEDLARLWLAWLLEIE